jgi:hypothetical protein
MLDTPYIVTVGQLLTQIWADYKHAQVHREELLRQTEQVTTAKIKPFGTERQDSARTLSVEE